FMLSGLAAPSYHLPEIIIKGNTENIPPQHLPHALGYFELVREQHKPRVGRPPYYRIAIGIPGEDTLRVRGDETFRRQVAPHCHHSVLFRQVYRRKQYLLIEVEYRHCPARLMDLKLKHFHDRLCHEPVPLGRGVNLVILHEFLVVNSLRYPFFPVTAHLRDGYGHFFRYGGKLTVKQLGYRIFALT